MIAIDVKNLSKVYKLYQSPAQRLKEIILRKPFHTDFTALSDINFSVISGETFGIIGENGAGKSTLLKILAKTLQPTSGTVTIAGRTAALLELGAGFNPELTGEENIYLNAYLLGLSKAEIDSKKQEIIAFSELGDFIKRPVKTYSSGMHVRLAFSIATSVNPDVLIVDEALSVGDEYFQKKCIDRMMNFRKAGKTIVFCSHSMYHVHELCQKAAWLYQGEVKTIGDADKVIIEYQNYERGKSAGLKDNAVEMVKRLADSPQEKLVRIVDAMIIGRGETETDSFIPFEPAVLSFKVKCSRDDIKGHIGFAIIRNDEIMTFGTMSVFDGVKLISFRDGQEFRIKIKSLPLMAGLYSILFIVSDDFALHPYDMLRTKTFSVTSGRKEYGMAYIEHEWII